MITAHDHNNMISAIHFARGLHDMLMSVMKRIEFSYYPDGFHISIVSQTVKQKIISCLHER